MLWFAVWTTLVLATLAGAVWLGLRLWRSGKALLAQLAETSAALDQLQDRIDALEAANPPEPVPVPSLLADEGQRARWRAIRATNLQRRAERRFRRRTATFARWESTLQPPR